MQNTVISMLYLVVISYKLIHSSITESPFKHITHFQR